MYAINRDAHGLPSPDCQFSCCGVNSRRKIAKIDTECTFQYFYVSQPKSNTSANASIGHGLSNDNVARSLHADDPPVIGEAPRPAGCSSTYKTPRPQHHAHHELSKEHFLPSAWTHFSMLSRHLHALLCVKKERRLTARMRYTERQKR